MRKILIACTGIVALGVAASGFAHAAAHAPAGAPAGAPKTHRLQATPAPVAFGYFWSDAPGVLRVDSGDIGDVDTVLTNTPTGLAKAGVPEDRIQASLKAIVTEVTGD